MSESAEGTAEAHDAEVATDSVPGYQADLVAEARAKVAGAQARVERQREHLAGAEQALEDARAALAAVDDGA